MKKAMLTIKYYLIGITFSLLIIGGIHLYSFLVDSYFGYATAENIIGTALISGIPFGLSAWAFIKLILENDNTTAHHCKAAC